MPDKAALADYMETWPVSVSVPEGVAGVLRVSRELLIHSYDVYEFTLVAVTWSLLALEASLRGCLAATDSVPLAELLQRAVKEWLLTDEEARVLGGSRDLRNRIVHGALDPTYAPGVAVAMVQGLHEAVSDIYTRAAARRACPRDS